MESDVMSSVLDDEPFLHHLLKTSPHVQQLMKAHPEFEKMLLDPFFLLESREAFKEPGKMRDVLGLTDTAVHSAWPNPNGYELLCSIVKAHDDGKKADDDEKVHPV